MTDEDAFLVKIRERPDDDVPRLVYADWLDEHREAERAKFIRVQCRLAELRSQPGWVPSESDMGRFDADRLRALWRLNNHDRESEIEKCRDRERELLVKNRQEWEPRYEERVRVGDGDRIRRLLMFDDYEFSRGFIDSIICPSAAWLAHGDAITRRHPVTRVRLVDRPDSALPPWHRPPSPDGTWSGFVEIAGQIVPFNIAELDAWDAEREEMTAYLLRLRWPGIAFDLPAETRYDVREREESDLAVAERARRFGYNMIDLSADPDGTMRVNGEPVTRGNR